MGVSSLESLQVRFSLIAKPQNFPVRIDLCKNFENIFYIEYNRGNGKG